MRQKLEPVGLEWADGPDRGPSPLVPLIKSIQASRRFASVGDTIETTLHGRPFKLQCTITTRAACAFANDLIAEGRWTVHDWCADTNCKICNERRKQEQTD